MTGPRLSPAFAAPKIHGIQLLRALAAIAVVIAHVKYDFDHNLSLAPYLPDFLNYGVAGVDLFFVISGFVIVHSSETLFGRRRAATTFAIRRVARIVPLYWLISLVMVAYVGARGFAASDASPALAAASFLFIPYARPSGDISPILGVGWTLNYEMFFYAVFALALGARRGATVIRTATLLATLVLAAALWPSLPMPLSYWADPVVLEFVLGMLIALLYRRGVRIPAWGVPLLCIATLAGVAAYVDWGEARASHWIGFGFPAAALVAALTLRKRDAGFLWIDRIGDASYALYLCHPIVVAAGRILSWQGYLAPTKAPWAYLAGIVGVSIATSLVLHRLVERPMTQGIRRLIRTGRTAPA